MHHLAKFCWYRLNRGRDMAIFRFFQMADAAILDFWNFKFLTVGTVKSVKLHHRAKSLTVRTVKRFEMHHLAKFRQHRLNRGRDMAIFQDGGRRHLGFLKFQIFNGRNGYKGQTASSCQISSISVEPRPRYGDFSIFQDDGCRHLGFLKFQIFNGRNG